MVSFFHEWFQWAKIFRVKTTDIVNNHAVGFWGEARLKEVANALPWFRQKPSFVSFHMSLGSFWLLMCACLLLCQDSFVWYLNYQCSMWMSWIQICPEFGVYSFFHSSGECFPRWVSFPSYWDQTWSHHPAGPCARAGVGPSTRKRWDGAEQGQGPWMFQQNEVWHLQYHLCINFVNWVMISYSTIKHHKATCGGI